MRACILLARLLTHHDLTFLPMTPHRLRAQVLVCGYRSSIEMLWHQVQGHGMGTHYVMLRAHLLRHYNGFEHPGDAVARYQVKVWIQR